MSDPAADNTRDPHDTSTGSGDAGPPANRPAQALPSDEELDRRDRLKAAPRRAAGPPLAEPPAEARGEELHEPPPATDPGSNPPPVGGRDAGSSLPGEPGTLTHASDAGLPADHAGPKPSHDDLDRRDRLKAGPRRAAGPPLSEPIGSARADVLHEPPPATDPE